MSKIKELCRKHREILMYLIFGVLTTVVGWAVYFAMLWILKAAMGIPAADASGGRYLVAYSIAQVVQWVAAVLFAFFTNRKWVFTEAEKEKSTWLQLAKFSAGRLLTFGIDYIVTFGVAVGLAALIPAMTEFAFLGRVWNLAEIGAKVLAAVIVIFCNYIFSKLFVFKNKKKTDR